MRTRELYSLIRFTYKLFIYKPWHVLTLFLLFHLVNKREDAEISSDLANYNQCPLEPFFFLENTCHPADELYEYYHVIKNTPSLSDVEYFLFAEQHNNESHYIKKFYFTEHLGRFGDIVYFEGVNAGEIMPCASIFGNAFNCRGWDNEAVRIKYTDDYIFYTEAYHAKTPFLKLHQACVNLTTQLLNNSESFEAASVLELKEMLRELISYKKYYQFLLSVDIVESNDLKALISIEEMLNVININFKKEFQFIHAEALRLSYQIITVRNRGAIGTINKLSHLSHRSFYFFGAAHLLKDTKCDEPDCFDVAKNDLQHELRKAFAKVPHAILIPKKR